MDISHDVFVNNRGDKHGHFDILQNAQVEIDGTIQDGEILQWNNTDEKFNNITGSELMTNVNIEDLQNINSTPATAGQIYINDGVEMIPADIVATITSNINLQDIGDTDVPIPNDGDHLEWVTANSKWEAVAPAAGGINDLADVNTTNSANSVLMSDGAIYQETTPAALMANVNINDINNIVLAGEVSGEYITFNGTNWVNTAAPAVGSTTITGLTDTTITAPSVNHVLTWSGTAWINQVAAGAGTAARVYSYGASLTGMNVFIDPNGSANTNYPSSAPTFNGYDSHAITHGGLIDALSYVASGTFTTGHKFAIYVNGVFQYEVLTGGNSGVDTGMSIAVNGGDLLTIVNDYSSSSSDTPDGVHINISVST